MQYTAFIATRDQQARRIIKHLHTKVLLLVVSLLLVLTSAQAQRIVNAQVDTYNEAPQLAELVAAGAIPPLEERLPLNPVVVEPLENIGVYGGTWRSGALEPEDTWMRHTVGYDHLVHWDAEWNRIIPNVVEFEVNDDATVYTLRLRDGLKWSDGHPYSADDLMFLYEDIFLHDELASFPSEMQTSVGHGVFEKVNDLTVTVTFPEPNGLFLDNIAASGGRVYTQYPKHYMQQFHPSYNEDTLEQLMSEEGVSSWIDLFEVKADNWGNPDKPTLNAWVVTDPFGEGTRVVAERNPYYWKVDIEGNQLPYIDRVVFTVFSDSEVLLLQALAGEVDFHGRHINTTHNLPVLADGMEQGDFRIVRVVPSNSNNLALKLNLTHDDPVLREVFNNKDFRIGLSHAINRQEIADLVFLGEFEIQQPSPMPEATEIYYERLAKQYTEYDVDLANEHLDRAGYAERDSEGFRLGPDGNRITFTIYARADQDFAPDSMDLVVRYWRAVGVDVHLRIIDRTLFREIREAGTHDAMMDSGGRAFLRDVLFAGGARYFLPTTFGSVFAPKWTRWYNGLEPSEEPPASVRRQFELFDQIPLTADADEHIALIREILEIAADNFNIMGVGQQTIDYVILKNNFRNVPENFSSSFHYSSPGPTIPPQYFIDTGSQ